MPCILSLCFIKRPPRSWARPYMLYDCWSRLQSLFDDIWVDYHSAKKVINWTIFEVSWMKYLKWTSKISIFFVRFLHGFSKINWEIVLWVFESIVRSGNTFLVFSPIGKHLFRIMKVNNSSENVWCALMD